MKFTVRIIEVPGQRDVRWEVSFLGAPEPLGSGEIVNAKRAIEAATKFAEEYVEALAGTNVTEFEIDVPWPDGGKGQEEIEAQIDAERAAAGLDPLPDPEEVEIEIDPPIDTEEETKR